MMVKFTAEKNEKSKGMARVNYYRDKDDGRGLIKTASYPTTNPFTLIGELIANIPFQPELINSISVTVTGISIDFIDN